jgi:hypothetical protein
MKARLPRDCWRCRHVLRYDYCDPSPDFEVKTLDGRPLKLSDCRGKYVVLDFRATSITRWKILPSLVSLSSLKDDFVALVECAGMRLSPVR